LKWRWDLPTSKTDSQGSTCTHDLTIRGNSTDAINCIDEINRRNPGWCQGYHYPKILFCNLFYCIHPKASAEMAIPGGRAAASLQVAEYNRPRFFAGAVLDFFSNHVTDAA
jgi:hypothetical protein